MNAFKLLIIASLAGLASHGHAVEPGPLVKAPAPPATGASAAAEVGRKTGAPLMTVDELWAVKFTRGARKSVTPEPASLDGLWDVKFTRAAPEKPATAASSGGCTACGTSKTDTAAAKVGGALCPDGLRFESSCRGTKPLPH